MKFFLVQIFLTTLSVIILYYLFDTTQFLPYLEDGGINWQNVLVLIFFLIVIVSNLVSLIYSLVSNVFFKKVIDRKLINRSVNLGVGVSIGLLLVLILNFLHILDIYYGLGVLLIGIIIFLVI